MGKPLMVQNDWTVLLTPGHDATTDLQRELAVFAELHKSPEEGVHTYKITPLTLWNAAAEGVAAEHIVDLLDDYDRFGLSASAKAYIYSVMERYGALRLVDDGGKLTLVATEWKVMRDVCDMPRVKTFLRERPDPYRAHVDPSSRGDIKLELLRAGYPVIDTAGYHAGERLPLALSAGQVGFVLRDYQQVAIDRFCREGSDEGGSGVVVLPCGAGKTVVGLALIARFQCATLILTSSATSVKQWRDELFAKTNAEADWIGEYTGSSKQVRPVTIATYQMMTYRKTKTDDPAHIRLFHDRDWGLVIYDEVHLLPAPVFRMTADIQATRRLGLTATLVREDGREEDVFSLIGPKRYELRWKHLENEGWIARAVCREVSVPFPPREAARYRDAPKQARHKLAGTNPNKLAVAQQLVARHRGKQTIVIGQYLTQLAEAARLLDAPLITGQTAQAERARLFNAFKSGDMTVLVVSKVANFALDLPEASVAIQISGSFGSRQEEAQRLGRILRPKSGVNEAIFYSLVTADSCEGEYARNRQLFLVEQGYEYRREPDPTCVIR